MFFFLLLDCWKGSVGSAWVIIRLRGKNKCFGGKAVKVSHSRDDFLLLLPLLLHDHEYA